MAAAAAFRAFISYSHADAEVAHWLQQSIETYRVPRNLVAEGLPAKLYPLFRDTADMRAGTDLKATIRDALLASDALIVVCSPAAALSSYVDLEIRTFTAAYPMRPVLAVIASGEPVPGSPRCCFPAALLEGGHEPGAADLRPGRDSRRSVRLKIVAGLLGVDVVALVQRDNHRRQLRLRWLVAAALLLATIMGLLWFRAVRARHEAERQRAAAEQFVEFMVGDLRKRLEPIGKLAILDAVAAHAFDYYKGQPHTALGPDSEARRARVLRMVGEIRNQEGDLDAALANYRAAATSTAALLAATPDDPQRIFDHAQSVYFIGTIAEQRHQLDAAEAAFREYAALAAQLVAHDPRNPAWRAETGYAASGLGTVLLDRGRNREAETQFRLALAVSLDAARAAPGDVQMQLDLGQSYAWLADPLMRRGDYAGALQQREAERAIYERLLAATPGDKQLLNALIDVDVAREKIFAAEGDAAKATAIADAALDSAKSLFASDRRNHVWARVLASTLVARAELLAGEESDAGTDLQRLDTLIAQVPREAMSMPDWGLKSARAELIRAELLERAHRDREALMAAQQAVNQTSLADSAKTWSELTVSNRARLQLARCLLRVNEMAAADVQVARVLEDLGNTPSDDVELQSLRQAAVGLHKHGLQPI